MRLLSGLEPRSCARRSTSPRPLPLYPTAPVPFPQVHYAWAGSHRLGRAGLASLAHPPSHSSRGRRVPRSAPDRCPSDERCAVVRSRHSCSTSPSAKSRTKTAASSCTMIGFVVGKPAPGTGLDRRHRAHVSDQPLEILCSCCTKKPGDVLGPTATAPGRGTGGRRDPGQPWAGEASVRGRGHLVASLRHGGELPGSMAGSPAPWCTSC